MRVGGCSAWQGILPLTCASGLVWVVCSSPSCCEDVDVLRCCAAHRWVPRAGAQLYVRALEFLSALFVLCG